MLQTVLTRVAGHWRKLADGGNPEAYARKALVNQTISWRRRRRPELAGAGLPELTELAEPGQPHDEATVRRLALRHALAELTPKQRAVIVLRFYEDRTEQETAELMGVAVGTVKSQTNYALAKLRALTPQEAYR
ncbi:sigma-70 family RNA polymerase sigma factor [Nonomuraea antri]|uniref:sigma-70 family RNA polymerase sigma factor n=1 Tax=Nonomuraea antri TaxID=2730852 RepID=UPI002E2DAD46|nr:sigma-70 family RNA polymerase sigma factor [Nonomuraea antri]